MRLTLVTLILALCLIFCSAAATAYPSQAAVTVKVFTPGGSPASGVLVTLQNGNYVKLANGTTDEVGTCSFKVSPGSGVVRAVLAGYNVTSVWHEAGNTTIEVKLPSAGEVSGTVKLDGMGAGNPIIVLDNAMIYDSTPYDVSRQNGSEVYTFTVNRFSLAATTGPHTLYAIGYSNNTVYRSDDLAINVSDTNAPVVLELRKTGMNATDLPPVVYDHIFHTSDIRGGILSIAGVLLDSDGRPVPNATLTAQDYFLKEPGSSLSGTDGSFVFGRLNVTTDFLRFKIQIPDNGSTITTYSQFYPAENMSALKLTVLDYPKPIYGYIYGIIALTDNRSNPVPISGIVYLSNGLSQQVSPDKDSGQFSFALLPGTYEIWAEHVDGGERLASEKREIEVTATWSALAVNPTILVVGPEKVQYVPLLISLLIGALCIGGGRYAIRRWL